MIASPTIDLKTPDLILALCIAREIERGFGPGGHTTKATQDAAIAALQQKEALNVETRPR